MWMSRIGDQMDDETMMRANEGGEHRRPVFLSAKNSIWVAGFGIWSQGELGGGLMKISKSAPLGNADFSEDIRTNFV